MELRERGRGPAMICLLKRIAVPPFSGEHRAMRCGIFFPAELLVWLTAAALPAQGSDPAMTALEKFRTDKERELSDLVEPPPKEPEAWPDGAEVFLVQGYLNYDCVRIFRKDGKPLVERVRMTRTWFYSPKESYTAEQWTVTEDQLRETWNRARRIRTTELKMRPRPVSPMSSSSFQSSSHEASVLVRIVDAAGDPHFLNAERGRFWKGGVQKVEAIQTRALYEVFETLIPKEEAGAPFALTEWEPFLVRLLGENLPHLTAQPWRDRGRALLVEVALQLLGQAGGRGALERVREASRVDPFRDDSVRAETKILLRDRFDAGETARLIHETGRRQNAEVDFVRWLRELYFERDADGYRALLVDDLRKAGSSPEILRESIADLTRRYPEQQASLLEGVLEHPLSEVRVETALALLQKDPGHPGALATLDQVAGDPDASIPANDDWFSRFGRDRALDYLADERKPVPSSHRWTLERVERQLQLPWEDGRMVRRLIDQRSILAKSPPPTDAQIAAYRRTLNGPINKGIEIACEALVALDDRESAERIAELEAGRKSGPAWQEDPHAKYPWIDQYGIERLRKKLEKLKAAQP
jgi:hypothetical protein